jgi:hypothetical protein
MERIRNNPISRVHYTLSKVYLLLVAHALTQLIPDPSLRCDRRYRLLLLIHQPHCSLFQQVAHALLHAFKEKVASLQPQRLFKRLPNDLSLSLLILGSGCGRWKTIECFCPSSSTCVNVKHEPPPGMTEQPASAIADTNSVQ